MILEDIENRVVGKTTKQSHTWDYKNHLITSGTGHATSTATYDPSGERITYTDSVGTTAYANKFYDELGDTKLKHIYAGDDLVATIETAPTQIVIVGDNLVGGGGGGFTSSLGTGGGGDTTPPFSHTVHFIHDDQLGSTGIVTSATSTLEETTDYYPFGKIKLDQTTTDFKEKRKFTGHIYDEQTQLSYMNARYQNGRTGRFLSEDPAFLAVGTPNLKQKTGMELNQYLADPQGLNSYSYVKNNPLKYKDPTGQWLVPVLVALFTPEVAYSPTSENFENKGLERKIFVASMIAGGTEGEAVNDSARIVESAGSKEYKKALEFVTQRFNVKTVLPNQSEISAVSEKWANTTFPDKTSAMLYHFSKHNAGNTLQQLTENGVKVWENYTKNSSLVRNVTERTLQNGQNGLKINLSNGSGGIFTSTGHIVSTWFH